jgi:hypothetical protein
MMNCKTLLLLCCSLLCCQVIWAVTLKGKITDPKGEAIPFATLQVSGTSNGTAANEDGYYVLQLPEGKATLVVRMIGYKPTYKTLMVSNSTETLDIVLEEESKELTEVTVKANAEDPAYAIMRQVIAQKSKHSKAIKTLEADVYLKGKLLMRVIPKSFFGVKIEEKDAAEMQKDLMLDSNNRGILYLLEQMTHYTYKAPKSTYNEAKAIKTSGDPKGLGFAQMPAIVNIYENNVSLLSGIGSRGFISPAHNNAFFYYRFRLLQSYMDNGLMIHKIAVIPKREYEPLFRGTVYVVEGDWVFQQVQLSLDKRAQMEMLDTLVFEQQYRKTEDSKLWVIQQQIMYPHMSLLGFKFSGDFVTNYGNIVINKPVNEKLFSSKIISTYDPESLSRDSSYWEQQRPISLSTEEQTNYLKKDSAAQIMQKMRDSLGPPSSRRLDFVSFLTTGAYIRKGHHEFGLSGLLNQVGYNTVEGLYTGLEPYWQYNPHKGDMVKLIANNRYGWANQQYQYMYTAQYAHEDTTRTDKGWKVQLSGGRYVFQINPDNPISAPWNTSVSLFYGANYMKLYQASIGRLNFENRWGNGLSLSADLRYEDRSPMENHTDYTFYQKRRGEFTPNNPPELPAFEAHKAAIATISLNYQPGWKYIQYPQQKAAVKGNAPLFGLSYSKGIAGIMGSRSDFDRWTVSVKDEFSMKLLGNIRYNVLAGGFLNKRYVGNPDMYHIMGNQTILSGQYLNSFQLAPYYRFSSIPSLYTEMHAEWHFNGWLTNKVPLFKRLNWHLVAAGNLMYINQNQYYGEYSVGLENIGFKFMKVLRVDLVAGYEQGKARPNYGLRLGLSGIFSTLK